MNRDEYKDKAWEFFDWLKLHPLIAGFATGFMVGFFTKWIIF